MCNAIEAQFGGAFRPHLVRKETRRLLPFAVCAHS